MFSKKDNNTNLNNLGIYTQFLNLSSYKLALMFWCFVCILKFEIRKLDANVMLNFDYRVLLLQQKVSKYFIKKTA